MAGSAPESGESVNRMLGCREGSLEIKARTGTQSTADTTWHSQSFPCSVTCPALPCPLPTPHGTRSSP